MMIADEVGDTSCQHTGFARSGTGNHKQRTVDRGDGSTLRWVKTFEKRGIGHGARVYERWNYRDVIPCDPHTQEETSSEELLTPEKIS